MSCSDQPAYFIGNQQAGLVIPNSTIDYIEQAPPPSTNVVDYIPAAMQAMGQTTSTTTTRGSTRAPSMQAVVEGQDKAVRRGLRRSCTAFQNFTPQEVNTMERLQTTNPDGLKRFELAFIENTLWPDREVLFCGFEPGSKASDREFVMETIDREFGPIVNLRFYWVPQTNSVFKGRKSPMEANLNELERQGLSQEEIEQRLQGIATDRNLYPMIRIGFRNEGAYSFVGSENQLVSPNDAQYGDLTMNFGWLDQGVVLHEFGHCLGAGHEHQRPNTPVEWKDKEEIYRWFGGPPNSWSRSQVDNNVFKVFDMDTQNSSVFDPHSIMLYKLDCNLFANPSDPNVNCLCTDPSTGHCTISAQSGGGSIQQFSQLDKATFYNAYPREAPNPFEVDGGEGKDGGGIGGGGDGKDGGGIGGGDGKDGGGIGGDGRDGNGGRGGEGTSNGDDTDADELRTLRLQRAFRSMTLIILFALLGLVIGIIRHKKGGGGRKNKKAMKDSQAKKLAAKKKAPPASEASK